MDLRRTFVCTVCRLGCPCARYAVDELQETYVYRCAGAGRCGSEYTVVVRAEPIAEVGA
jgi:hypothetical protein